MGLRSLFILTLVVLNIPLSLMRPFYGLLCYSFLAYSHFDTLTWSQMSGLRLSFISGCALIAGTLLAKERLAAFNKRVILIVIFWILSYMSLMLSGDFWSTEFDTFTKVLIVILVVTGLVRTPQRFYYFCLLISVFIGLYAARQGVIGILVGAKNMGGHVGENNYYGAWISTLFPFVYCMAKTERRRWLKFLLYSCLPGMILAVFNTYSRGAYLGIAAVILYLAYRSKYKIRNLVVLGIIGIVGFGLLPQGIRDEAFSIKTARQENESSVLGRIHFWRTALVMTSENPLLGVGFKKYEKVYDQYDSSYGTYGHNRSVHETFLQVLSENGIPAFSIFIFLFISTFTSGYWIRKRLKMVAESDRVLFRYWSYMLEGGLVGFSVCGLFISAGYLDILWYVFALSIALTEIFKALLKKSQASDIKSPA